MREFLKALKSSLDCYCAATYIVTKHDPKLILFPNWQERLCFSHYLVC